MIQKNPYAAYNNSKIQTATPAELTLLLYEGAIKFTNIAIVAIEKGDIEKAHNNIRKAENIIREFQITLDHKYAVAKDFDAVYTYLLQRLLEANMKKDNAGRRQYARYIYCNYAAEPEKKGTGSG